MNSLKEMIAANSTTKDLNWPEDFAGENGMYTCKCHKCGEEFLGHKRRITCKLCYREFPTNLATPPGRFQTHDLMRCRCVLLEQDPIGFYSNGAPKPYQIAKLQQVLAS